MGYPGPGMATDAGVWAGIERARAQNAASEQARNQSDARKAKNLVELQRRQEMRDAGMDPGVHEKLSRIEAMRAQRETQREATTAYGQKVSAIGGTPGSVVIRLSRMTPAEQEAYYEKYPAARSLADRVDTLTQANMQHGR